MNVFDIIFCVCALAVLCYGVYFFYVKKLLFEKKYASQIEEYTPKIMVRARPFRDDTLLSDPDSIKYDVYVLNSFKAFYKYMEFTKYDNNPKELIKRTNSTNMDSVSNERYFFIDSTFDSLENAKERATYLLDKINSPNIYTESAKFNDKEIKDFNKKLNKIPDGYFSE